MSILKSIYQHTPGNIVFFDTETTDLRPGEIAQLSYIVTDANLLTIKAKNFYFKVENMSDGASQVNGLTVEKLLELSEGKKFADHYEEIHNDFGQQYLVAHNIKFDINFLTNEFSRRGVQFLNEKCFCTMNYFKIICAVRDSQGKIKYPKLAEVLKYFLITDEEVGELAGELFGEYNVKCHDSRFDTAALYLICKRAHEEENFAQQTVG